MDKIWQCPTHMHSEPVISTHKVQWERYLWIYWWSYEGFCLPIDCHCSSTCFDFWWQYISRERPKHSDCIAMIAVVNRCLYTEAHGGEVMSVVLLL